MPLSDSDHTDILETLRKTMREGGLGATDERIMSEMRGTETPFGDLALYLKLLISDLSLGSDAQVRSVLRRLREASETETGTPIQGFRVELSPEESRRYRTEFVDFSPPPELNAIIEDLRTILEELYGDREGRTNREPGERET